MGDIWGSHTVKSAYKEPAYKEMIFMVPMHSLSVDFTVIVCLMCKNAETDTNMARIKQNVCDKTSTPDH